MILEDLRTLRPAQIQDQPRREHIMSKTVTSTVAIRPQTAPYAPGPRFVPLALLLGALGMGSLGACDRAPRDEILDPDRADEGCEIELEIPKILQGATHPSGDLVYGHQSAVDISVTGAPADTDPSRWDLTYDDHGDYILYHLSLDNKKLYRFLWTGTSYAYDRELALEHSGSTNGDDPETAVDWSKGFAVTHFDGYEWSMFWNVNKAGNGLINNSFHGDTGDEIDFAYDHDAWMLQDLGGAKIDHWAVVDSGTNSSDNMHGVKLYVRDGSSNTLVEWGNWDLRWQDLEGGQPGQGWFYPEVFKTGNTVRYTGFPEHTNHGDFGMMHDGTHLRVYLPTRVE
ncbi:MAG: hypothetical protein AB1Z98_05115 [Nannocystaceae bacterium]